MNFNKLFAKKMKQKVYGDMDFTVYQAVLQHRNKRPNLNSKLFGRMKKNMVKPEKHINILYQGDIFGEIGVLTNLNRTCTVKTRETCVFQTLNKDAMA